MTTMLLACYGRERKPRSYGTVKIEGDNYVLTARQIHAWHHARRWWLVEAPDAIAARFIISAEKSNMNGCKIVSCGRNARE